MTNKELFKTIMKAIEIFFLGYLAFIFLMGFNYFSTIMSELIDPSISEICFWSAIGLILIHYTYKTISRIYDIIVGWFK